MFQQLVFQQLVFQQLVFRREPPRVLLHHWDLQPGFRPSIFRPSSFSESCVAAPTKRVGLLLISRGQSRDGFVGRLPPHRNYQP
ncbi:MAG: hypothetical protein NXI04_21760 [Planctomycetaceae bacterium]|nr:hypothetical protein [Planctomycetaceae bacterium]